jgi:DNA-binding transcriptional LysR family regulator
MIHDYAALSARNIGTDLLRTLVVLMEERSYTRAANRLGLSQPTVSSHIRRLQEQLSYRRILVTDGVRRQRFERAI